jgi:enoyl-ACP reductase-like protein
MFRGGTTSDLSHDPRDAHSFCYTSRHRPLDYATLLKRSHTEKKGSTLWDELKDAWHSSPEPHAALALQQLCVAKTIPVGRVGQPRDVANVICFLASEEAGFVSGQIIYVAGGPRG